MTFPCSHYIASLEVQGRELPYQQDSKMQLIQLPWARATKQTAVKLKAVYFPLKSSSGRCDVLGQEGTGI